MSQLFDIHVSPLEGRERGVDCILLFNLSSLILKVTSPALLKEGALIYYSLLKPPP